MGDLYEGVAQLKSTVWQAHLTHARSICHAALHDRCTEVHGSCTQAMRPRMHAMPCHAGLHACNVAMHALCSACMHCNACGASLLGEGGSLHASGTAPTAPLPFFFFTLPCALHACMHACMLVCARLQALLPRNRGHENILQAPHPHKSIRGCQRCPFAMGSRDRVEGVGSWFRVMASTGPALLSKAVNLRQTALAGRPNQDI